MKLILVTILLLTSIVLANVDKDKNIQTNIAKLANEMENYLDADKVIIGVMNSKTGELISLASSGDNMLNSLYKAMEYRYEPGSVFKPFTLAVALDKDLLKPNTIFPTFNGIIKLGDRVKITDYEKFKELSATDIIVHSSNVGISQISWLMTGQEFRDGLLKFNIDSLKSAKLLDRKLHRANTSYGYSVKMSFMELLEAYSAFNNEGVIVSPSLIESEHREKLSVSASTANQINKILQEVVNRGTGIKAKYDGLIVGGKTGTAHMQKNGMYVAEYNSSFYGFANDNKGNKYTIGVLVVNAQKSRHYYSSLSAVPTFRKTLDVLVEFGYLKSNNYKVGM